MIDIIQLTKSILSKLKGNFTYDLIDQQPTNAGVNNSNSNSKEALETSLAPTHEAKAIPNYDFEDVDLDTLNDFTKDLYSTDNLMPIKPVKQTNDDKFTYGLIEPKVEPASNADRFKEFILSKEGRDNTYTTKNKAGSSAYGKFQFIESTGKALARELKLKGSWKEPANQEKIFNLAVDKYVARLHTLNVPVTEGNIYAVHQLGHGRVGRLFKDKLTSKDIKILNYNLPKDLKVEYPLKHKKEVISKWKAKYLN